MEVHKSDWQVHARTSRASITIKLFVWASIAIKTFGTKQIEESKRTASMHKHQRTREQWWKYTPK